jgi:uncharacterized membrane protein YqaE (UPF0057 family)
MPPSTCRNLVGIQPTCVALPKNSPRKTFGLIVLTIFFSPMAVYLDGGFNLAVWLNFILWFNLLWPISIACAIGYVLRSERSRKMSRPMRYSLWVRHPEGPQPHSQIVPSTKTSTAPIDENRDPVPASTSSLTLVDNPFRDT